MGDIRFIKGQGGLNAQAPGEDHYSGLIVYCDTLPAGFSSTSRVKEITDLPAAEALGIVNDKTDETKASGGKVVITTAGATGNVEAIVMDGVILGSYTVIAADTVNLVAAGLRSAINAGTSGYVAAGTGADVTLTPPAGLGDSINGGTLLSFTTSGTGAATVTQFTGGIDAFMDVVHYHIAEIFRINPSAKLYLGIFAVPVSTYSFDEITEMQNAADGKLRQVGVYLKDEALSTGHLSSIQTICSALATNHKPLSIIYAADISAISDLTALSNLKALTSPNVSVVIGQDGGNEGLALFADKDYSIGCIGATIGAVTLASVHENIGWVAKFNMSGNNELETPAIANGTLVSSLSDNAIAALDTKGYIFIKKHIGIAGTYFYDDPTCVSATNDYNCIERNRTMDKAIRNVRTNLLPYLNGPIYVDPTSGKLNAAICKNLETVGNKALEDMERNGELSGFQTFIDPNQNILTTSNLNIVITNVAVGVSRNITVKISYTTSI
jgi:hypothetical protein